MPAELSNIIWSAVGILVTGLVTWLVAMANQWINSKIKDQKAASFATQLMSLVGNCVMQVYQTYVAALKDKDAFTKEAQEEALNKCLIAIKSQMAPELVEYVKTNYGDVEDYLKTLIESTIYNLKR